MSSPNPVLTGSCQCGHVKYSSTSLPESFTNCHCQTCRKRSGAPFITFGEFPSASITFTSGAESMKTTYSSDIAVRTHCAGCGSPISMRYNCEPDSIHITARTIDEETVKGPVPRVKQDIFVERGKGKGKGDSWYEVPDDGVPKYERFSNGFQEKIDAWKKVSLSQPGSG